MVDPVSKIKVIMTANSKQLRKELADSSKSAEGFGTKIKGVMTGATKALAGVTLAVAALGAGMTAGFVKNAVKTWIDFEKQMARVKAITKSTDEDMATVQTTIRDVAKESRFTASEVAQATQVLALAGLTVDELGSATAGAVLELTRFAEAAGGDVEMAAGVAIAGVKAFGLEVEQMGEVTAVMTNTFTSSFTNLEQLGQAMKFLGPTANAAGVSISEAAAAVGALGNAGLQGTIAGTGLRMSINKLISPTDDARRAMDRLGLDFLQLTPAGQTAQATFRSLSVSIDALKADIEKTTSEMKILQGQMSDMSIEEQRNALAIARIRQKANREGRALTEEELETIGRLESANEDLNIRQQEANIASQELKREQDKNRESLSAQTKARSEANQVMSAQVTGITSLLDVITQLNESGATTAEILEIFSVRGGTAMMALLGQADAMRKMTSANEEAIASVGTADDVMMNFITDLQSTDRELAIMRADFEETALVIGQAFLEAMQGEDFIRVMKEISAEVQANKDDFVELGRVIATTVLPLVAQLPKFISDFTNLMTQLRPIIVLVVGVATVIMGILILISKVLEALATVGRGGGGRFGGKKAESVGGGAVSGAGAGASIGATVGAIGGPLGVGGGALVGGAIGAVAGGVGGAITPMAEGGVVMKPTLALVGEAGPEAVIPLSQATGADSPTGMVFNFDSINISGANMNEGDVRNIIRTEFPKIIRGSYSAGARGVV